MKILKLTKVKFGDSHSLIRVTYKTLFGSKQRDVIRVSGHRLWIWADSNECCLNDELFNAFNESNESEYILNSSVFKSKKPGQ